ncbi:SET domain-containing protein SmydA-8-like isoform X2 [Coccinella septempunctata]|nr:SET domain-containing protein SmydA-8-like isoform X2 [Coccinella septempunctata]
MVAKNDIKAGKIIIRENPLVVGPCVGGKIQCIGCYKNLEDEDKKFRCMGCGWPMCSKQCPGIDEIYGHTKIECSVLKECHSKTFFTWDDIEDMRTNYHSIVPLRCLILKSTDPTSFQTLMDMESHNEIRKNIPAVWLSNQNTVVDTILGKWKLTEYTAEEIHTICGILEVNAFEIGHQGVNIRGIYPTAFLMSHDCVPNTNHSDDGINFTLTVRASVDIPENHPITLSYAYTLQGTLRRREHLLDNKFFECYCRRCSDPSELGTFVSALLCPKCKTGYVLSDDPLNNDSTWSCNNTKEEGYSCPGYTISSKSVRLLIDRISREYETIDCNDIDSLEFFLKKYRNVLHPNHYICLGVKLSLSQLYGKIDGYLIYELTDKQLSRKIEICKEIMQTFDVIEPGLTKLRGVTLYELHAPLMVLLTREFERGFLTKDDIKSRLREVVSCLIDARNILELEPKISTEGAMGVAAQEALLQIKDWEKIIGKI